MAGWSILEKSNYTNCNNKNITNESRKAKAQIENKTTDSEASNYKGVADLVATGNWKPLVRSNERKQQQRFNYRN